MPDPINDDFVFWEVDAPAADKVEADITISSDDKKEDVPEKKEEKAEESKSEDKTEDKVTETSKEEPKEEPKQEDKTDDDSEDLDLSDLFADLDDTKNAIDDSKKILDDATAAGTITPEQVKELQTQIAILRDINDKNEKTIKKLLNDSVDMTYKNAELEAFGWVWTDPNVLILSKNIEKAKSGDDKSKSKVVSILKTLFEEFTGENLEKAQVDKQVDLLTAVDSYNTNANPNIKQKSSNTIEWLSI